jgi:hypothetical protein
MTTRRGYDSEQVQQQRARVNGGNIAHMRRTRELSPQERWKAAVPAVLRRFKRMMNDLYRDEDGDCEG